MLALLLPIACCLLHLITLFARDNRLGSMLTPICFAILRFTASSNFIGRSTGKSVGFVPLRILSTQLAALQNNGC